MKDKISAYFNGTLEIEIPRQEIVKHNILVRKVKQERANLIRREVKIVMR